LTETGIRNFGNIRPNKKSLAAIFANRGDDFVTGFAAPSYNDNFRPFPGKRCGGIGTQTGGATRNQNNFRFKSLAHCTRS